MKIINIRLPEDLIEKIERKVSELHKINPGMKVTRSDVIRNILELYFEKKGGK